MSTGLNVIGQWCDLRLDMLEAVDCIEELGKTYHWAQYVADMVKIIILKCQEGCAVIRFPSLIIWISMYHLFLVGDPQFLEPTRFWELT